MRSEYNAVRPGVYRVKWDPNGEFVVAEVKQGVFPTLNVRPKEGRYRGVWLTLAIASITIAAI